MRKRKPPMPAQMDAHLRRMGLPFETTTTQTRSSDWFRVGDISIQMDNYREYALLPNAIGGRIYWATSRGDVLRALAVAQLTGKLPQQK